MDPVVVGTTLLSPTATVTAMARQSPRPQSPCHRDEFDFLVRAALPTVYGQVLRPPTSHAVGPFEVRLPSAELQVRIGVAEPIQHLQGALQVESSVSGHNPRDGSTPDERV